MSLVSSPLFGTAASLGLFLGMVGLIELGRWLGKRRARRDAEGARSGLGAIEGAIFGLMGLLIAFSFSGAASRFDARRSIIVHEANAIGTAWLRLDLLPTEFQAPLRGSFIRYLDSRLAVYSALPDIRAAEAELARASKLQDEIWDQAVSACRTDPGRSVMMAVVPALNGMFDAATSRTMASLMHPPGILYVMLGFLSLATALLAGYGLAGGLTRSWIHTLGFAAIMSCTLYIILDYEFPRVGSIHVGEFDRVLLDIRQSMTTTPVPARDSP